MKKLHIYLMLYLLSLILGCSSKIRNEEITGVWVNFEEKCKVILNKDFTFSSINLPRDADNNFCLSYYKDTELWKGTWALENNQVKLIMKHDNYYYLKIDYPLIAGEVHLYLKLLDEVGGNFIYLDKLK